MAGLLDTERLHAAVDSLATSDQDVARVLARIGYPPPRRREPSFATLAHIVLAQQVSVASAAAVWRKLEGALGGDVTAERFLTLGDPELRAIGFSGRKTAYVRGLAEALVAGELDLASLALLDEEQAIAAITRLKGFGHWSAEIYLLFALGRADVFPADDLGLQIGMQRLKGLEVRPNRKALDQLAEPWRPWRGCGAIFLWHYYGAATLDAARPGAPAALRRA
jgi:DNA-3-methyladenine glycosylase II